MAGTCPRSTGGWSGGRGDRQARAVWVLLAAAVTLGGAAPGGPGNADLTADAITRATTRNLSTGDVAWLADGRTPDADPAAGAMTWEGVGLLAVSWPDTVRLAAIRVYLGQMGRYRVFGYLGGRYDDYGDRVDEDSPVYGREDRVAAGAAGWCEIPFAPEVAIDNLNFQVIDGAVIYEIQYLGPAGEPIRPAMGCGRRPRPAPVAVP